MKNHRSILLVAALAAFSCPGILIVDASPHRNTDAMLSEAIQHAVQSFEITREVDHEFALVEIALAQNAIANETLAWQPVSAAPAQIEEATCNVPQLTICSGYQSHAWLDPHRIRCTAAYLNLHSRSTYPLRRC